MKKITFVILISLVFGLSSNSQNVSVTDSNFLSTLISLGVDTNDDSQISFTEAANVEILDVSSQEIANLDGISAFINITELTCSENTLNNLDLTDNVLLTSLNCSSNMLYNLDISNCNMLQTLDCSNNPLTILNLDQTTLLEVLDCENNDLESLSVSNMLSLYNLNCTNNEIINLDISLNTELIYLNCAHNELSNLVLETNPLLKSIDCSYNHLSDLDFSTNTSMIYVDCSYNILENLDVINTISLKTLLCFANQLTTIDLRNNIYLQTLKLGMDCGCGAANNYFQSVDLSQNTALTVIDLSKIPSLSQVCVWSMPFPTQTIAELLTALSPDVYFTDHCTTDIENDFVEVDEFNIYPNPASDFITIDTPSSKVSLLTIDGKTLEVFEDRSNSSFIGNYSKGMYLLQIETNNQTITRRVIFE